jgi:hypothetical protein
MKTEAPKPRHTPGPWHRNIPPAKKYNTVFAGRNTHVCHLTVTGLTDEEVEANCDLIAAAPELLKALKSVRRMIDEALPKFNWGASALDANAIRLLNEVPAEVTRAIIKAEGTK